MQPITQAVRDTVLSLIAHENHRKLATMLMDGKTDEEIKVHGFDDLQIQQYSGLIASVISGDTSLKADAPAEVATPEDTPTPSEEVTPSTEEKTEDNSNGGANVVAETPKETPVDAEDPATETTTEPETSASEDEATDPIVEGEIPA